MYADSETMITKKWGKLDDQFLIYTATNIIDSSYNKHPNLCFSS